MAMVTISDQDPRSIKAVEVAATASQWLRCRTRDGVRAFGIPCQSETGRYHLVTTDRCDCEDAQWHAGKPCKHQLAVRLFMALAKGSQPPVRHRAGLTAFVAARTTADGTVVYMPRPVRDTIAGEPAERFWHRFED